MTNDTRFIRFLRFFSRVEFSRIDLFTSLSVLYCLVHDNWTGAIIWAVVQVVLNMIIGSILSSRDEKAGDFND